MPNSIMEPGPILCFFLVLPVLCWSKFNIDDTTLYSIKFNKADDETLLNHPPELLQKVTMTTSHNEKYVCELPSEESKKEAEEEEYTVSNFIISYKEKNMYRSRQYTIHL